MLSFERYPEFLNWNSKVKRNVTLHNNVVADNMFFIISNFSKNDRFHYVSRFISRILIHCVKWISFNSYGTKISNSRHLKGFLIVVCDTFNLSAIYHTDIWQPYSITTLIWSSSALVGQPECWSSLNSIF